MSGLRKLLRVARDPAELSDRLRQLALARGERWLPGVFTRPGALPRLASGLSASQVTRELVCGRNSPVSAAAGSRQTLQAALTKLRPELATELVARADGIVRGSVSLMGLGNVQVGSPTRWHVEPLAGRTAPQGVHWSQVDFLNPDVVGDHKILWEFNRHQQLVTLAQAWVVTGDERWADSAFKLTGSWWCDNPPGIGVNWASSLEVAYRAISWCWMLALLRECASLTDAWCRELLASIDAHGRHLERYLSTYFSPNTHLTGEALGLLYIGTMFPWLRDAARWRHRAHDILEREAATQVSADGVYFEQASQYQRYTAEIYLHFLLLSQREGLSVSESVLNALHRQFDVLLHLSAPDGSIPLKGDDDGGQVLLLDSRPPDQVEGLLAAAAIVLARPDLAWVSRGGLDYATWLLGAGASDRHQRLGATPPRDTTVYFEQGGLFATRESWERDSGQAIVDGGPHGALSGAHGHADALSVEIAVGGTPIFIDRGTYTYVGQRRNEFRVTASHNTLEMDGESAGIPQGPFGWRSRDEGHVVRCGSGAAGLSWFEGYRDLGTAAYARHTRRLLHPERGIWIIDDVLQSSTPHTATVRWYCAPGIVPVLEQARERVAVIRLDRAGVHVATLVMMAHRGRPTVESTTISRRYGSLDEASVCVWHAGLGDAQSFTSLVIDPAVYPMHNSRLILADGFVVYGAPAVNPDTRTLEFGIAGAEEPTLGREWSGIHWRSRGDAGDHAVRWTPEGLTPAVHHP